MAAAVVPVTREEAKFKYDMNVPFASQDHAVIVYNSLVVDEELQPKLVIRDMSVDKDVLKVTFYTNQLRILRVSVSSFYDMLTLATKTVAQFGAASGVQ
mmetsp:Transcript_13155/g.34418  ORF Transcript_13155/g.34418 Transcript_13155/m.34418 type:complete len:99 (-) Transcript_13155:1634-1930(-)